MTEVKLEEPLSGQLVEDMKEQGNQVTLAVAVCKEKYEKLLKRAQKVKQQEVK